MPQACLWLLKLGGDRIFVNGGHLRKYDLSFLVFELFCSSLVRFWWTRNSVTLIKPTEVSLDQQISKIIYRDWQQLSWWQSSTYVLEYVLFLSNCRQVCILFLRKYIFSAYYWSIKIPCRPPLFQVWIEKGHLPCSRPAAAAKQGCRKV